MLVLLTHVVHHRASYRHLTPLARRVDNLAHVIKVAAPQQALDLLAAGAPRCAVLLADAERDVDAVADVDVPYLVLC